MTRSSRWLVCFGMIGLVGLVWPATTNAAQSNPAKGISISPFQQQLTIAPADVAKSFELRLTNHTSVVQELKLAARDFGSLNETGGILLEGSNSYTQKYGLASWIKLGTDTVVIPPGASRSLTVTIDNRTSLRPGGHYGAVAARVTSLTDQTDNKVAINQELLSLIFVTKLGGEKYDLKLTNFSHNGNWLHLPNTIKLRFQNPGNVHVIPRGEVKLKSPSGTVVAKGIINSESAFVLPETFRELYVPLTRVGSALPLPGLYHVEVQYRYEGVDRVAIRKYNLQFISLGLYLLVAIMLSGSIWWLKRAKKAAKKT